MRDLRGGDVIGDGMGYGGGAGAWWGIWIFAFLIIFFIVLVFMWRKNDGYGEGHFGHLGGLAGLLPLLGYNGCRKTDEDTRVEQAKDTGKIIHDMDVNARYLESKVDRNLIEQAQDRIRSLEIKHAEEKAAWLQEKTANEIVRSAAYTNHRLDMIEGKMMKEPRFVAYGTHESYFHNEEPRHHGHACHP